MQMSHEEAPREVRGPFTFSVWAGITSQTDRREPAACVMDGATIIANTYTADDAALICDALNQAHGHKTEEREI